VTLKTTPNYALIDPHVKIRGGVGDISLPIVEALPTTEPPKYILAIHCAPAEHGGLIKIRKRKFMGKT